MSITEAVQAVPTGIWKSDSIHSSLGFAVQHMGVSAFRGTFGDFDVLAQLAYAPDRQLRRVDLARVVLLSASGVTRLLDGLERAGFVEKGTCASDARVTYAVLTETGLERFRAARRTHIRDVEELFGSRFSDGDRQQLTALLARLLEPADDEEPACAAEPE